MISMPCATRRLVCILGGGLLYVVGMKGAYSLPAEVEPVLDEVVVYAQKRAQNLQDVGVSVSALSGDLLSNLDITNTMEITQQVPGLQVTAMSPAVTVFNLRGVSQNSFTDNLEAPIAVYIDDAYVSSMNAISGQMFDMESVEVLRGPQGTLFGRNATGGLISFRTRGADDTDTNGYTSVDYESYAYRSVEAALGGSLSERVRGRVAGRWENGNGYVKAAIPTARDVGGANGWAGRGALQIDVQDSIKIDLRYKYSEDSDVPTGGYVVIPYADQDAGYIPVEWIDYTQNVIFAGAANPPAPYDSWRTTTAAIFFNPVDVTCPRLSVPR